MDEKRKMKCLFCNFIKGKQRDNKDYPFKIIHETKDTVSFLSTDFPKKEDGHMLIIPKKHFKYIELIPREILHELIEHVRLAAKVLRKTHKGCNVWINDGKEAEQKILHVHFHIIPRDKKDNIKIKVWKRRRLSKKEFDSLHNKLKKGFDREKTSRRVI